MFVRTKKKLLLVRTKRKSLFVRTKKKLWFVRTKNKLLFVRTKIKLLFAELKRKFQESGFLSFPADFRANPKSDIKTAIFQLCISRNF